MQTRSPAMYPVGTQFMTRGKYPRLCTVVNIHTTTNLAGNVVRVEYVATLDFCGQTVADEHVCEVTIARGLVSKQD